MSDPTEYMDGLIELAPHISGKRRALFARVRYDAMSDALYWSDEVPTRLYGDAQGALRYLLRYRTTLILGRPDDDIRPLWERARQLFGTWIGFDDRRCRPTQRLARLYKQEHQRFRQEASRLSR